MLEWPLEYIGLQILSNEIKSIPKYNLKLCNESQEELYSNLPHIFGSITTVCVDNGKKILNEKDWLHSWPFLCVETIDA